MTRKRNLLLAIALSCALLLATLCAAAPSEAQPARAPYRIGVLRNPPPTDAVHQAFVAGLREHGWVEGKNITIEYRQGEVTQFPALARELVQNKVDVIFAPNPQGAIAARQATTTIPIVFAVVGDPVRTGLAKSLAHPGGNVTGLTGLGSDLGGKRLEILKELVPRMTRVVVLWNSSVPDKLVEFDEMQAPARALGLELRSIEVRTPEDFPPAFDAIARAKPGGLIGLGEPLVYAHRNAISEFALRNRLPVILNWREAVDAGTLVSYGPNIADLYRRAAGYVDRILKGAKPADIPIEQPTKFELAVNVKTARALGLTVPPTLRLRADHIVE